MSVVSHGGCEPSFPVRATLGGLAGLWAVGEGLGWGYSRRDWFPWEIGILGAR